MTSASRMRVATPTPGTPPTSRARAGARDRLAGGQAPLAGGALARHGRPRHAGGAPAARPRALLSARARGQRRGARSHRSGRRAIKEVVSVRRARARSRGRGQLGVLTREGSAAVTGARALYALALRRPGETGTGSLQLRVTDTRSRRSGSLRVDAQRNALVPGDRLPRFIGLEPAASYALDLAGKADLGASGTATRLVYCLDGERAVEPVSVLQAGSARVVRGATGLWLLLPDDDAADNDGGFRSRSPRSAAGQAVGLEGRKEAATVAGQKPRRERRAGGSSG